MLNNKPLLFRGIPFIKETPRKLVLPDDLEFSFVGVSKCIQDYEAERGYLPDEIVANEKQYREYSHLMRPPEFIKN